MAIGQNRNKLEVEIASRDSTGEYNITGDGFGLNQLVFLFYYLSTSERGSTILIEEPEISLHPQAQVELSTILIDTSIKEEKQLMITTHSEHVVLALLEAIMEKKLDANDLRMYYFEKDNGITRISKLQIDENGLVEEGLKGFFDVDMKHINRLFKVLKKAD